MVRVPLTAAQIERGRLLGAALRQARGSATMVEVAHRGRVSVETLRKIETGRSPSPEFFTIASICGALGITTDDVMRLAANADSPGLASMTGATARRPAPPQTDDGGILVR